MGPHACRGSAACSLSPSGTRAPRRCFARATGWASSRSITTGTDSLFAFASEIKALLEHPAISAELEESVLPEYLAFGYASGDQTLFRGIRKLMPGHHLTLDSRTPAHRTLLGCARAAVRARGPRRAMWIAECRQRLEETVRMRLMSDVPLGMFLSGGVDSSAIAALMKGMVAGPMQTFSVGYARVRRTASLGLRGRWPITLVPSITRWSLGRDEFFDALPRLIWHEDEPITWPSSVSLYFVSRLASQHVKVVLTGEGSDEIFAGYDRYAHYFFNRTWMDRYRVVPAPVRRGVRRWTETSRLLPGSLRRKLGHTFLGREDSFESLHLDNFYGAFSRPDRERLFRNGGLQWDAAYEHMLAPWMARPNASPLSRMLYADQKTYLVELLMKQDQMSMATSIESRVPLLDHPFVEFAARVPDQLKIRDGVGKYIFKKAVEDLLPHSIVHRKKMGFPTPVRRWLQQPPAPLLARLRSGDGLLAAYVDRGGLDRLLADHMAGRVDGTDRIWRLLNLQVWGELFLAGNRLSPESGLMREEAGAPR